MAITISLSKLWQISYPMLFKYCGKDKYVRIELKKVGRNVRFDVIDHGDGIAAEEISHVWERYYRTSANRNRNIEGTGLGYPS